MKTLRRKLLRDLWGMKGQALAIAMVIASEAFAKAHGLRPGDRFAVYVVEKDRAKARGVEIGRRNGLAAQILSGLSEGESVILHPGDTVAEGKKVRLPRCTSRPPASR